MDVDGKRGRGRPRHIMTAGYSGTPLPQKLGLAKLGDDAAIEFINAPQDVLKELGVKARKANGALDFAMVFVKSSTELKQRFPGLAKSLAPAGMLWVAWPKKSSGIASDLSEDVVRNVGLKNGVVDVKVCAVTEIWSGLKFVIRLKNRAKRK
jgi:hypothetical protein